MGSRSLKDTLNKSKFLRASGRWEAKREERVGRGMAEQSRAKGGSNEKKLHLGRGAAKALIGAARKRTLSKKLDD